MVMQYFCPAKINLFLHITAKRTDGYHNLQSVFRALDFGDTLTIRQTDGTNQLHLTGAEGLTDTPEQNLITKAFHALKSAVAHTHPILPSVHIHLDKCLPTGAGLGGGSSNCAGTLLALTQFWQLNLSYHTLQDIGATLGADVPFFIFAKEHPDAIACGTGDILHAITLPRRRYLLLLPKAHISTATLFANPTLKRDSTFLDTQTIFNTTAQYLDNLTPPFYNAFEALACTQSPDVAEALLYLRTLEAISNSRARMTGTGSVVYLPLPTMINENTLSQWQRHAPCPSLVCHSLA